MWGIIPAAGKGSRIQPLAFSKELLPMGGHFEGVVRRPRAVSDYLMERLTLAGARRICFVISPDKADILEYYGGVAWSASVCYAVQPHPNGLCDAIFRALLVIDRNAPVLIGLPDTIWFPEDGLAQLPDDRLSFLLFPVVNPQQFDSVECESDGRVSRITVKDPAARSNWVWGAFKMPGSTLWDLFDLWNRRECKDEYIGTLINAWMAEGGQAWGVPAGETYFDVGTMDGYLQAMKVLSEYTGPQAGRQVA
jgi:glucose-1-phosphate thymidylyltransferase